MRAGEDWLACLFRDVLEAVGLVPGREPCQDDYALVADR